MVLVAGLGVSSRYWLPLARRLGGKFDLVAPDLPGFGRTPRPAGTPWPGGPDAREQADQLLAWMDARGIGRATLCGHSNGCQVVVEAAARRPERVDRLILLAPTYEIGKRTLWQQLPRLLAAAAFERTGLFGILARDYGAAGIPRALQQGVRMLAYPMECVLPRVIAPALVVHGRWDPLTSLRWERFIASQLGGGAVAVEIDRAGHAIQYTAAAVTAEVIEQFMCGRLCSEEPEGRTITGIDDPRLDPLAAPQPIPPTASGAIGYALWAIATALPWVFGWRGKPKLAMTVVAAANAAVNACSDHDLAATRRLPMVAKANADMAVGIALVATAAAARRSSPGQRLATAALGAACVALGALTSKPTGPARVVAKR